MDLQVEHEIELYLFLIKLVLLIQAEFVLVEPVCDLFSLRTHDVTFEFHEVFIKCKGSSLGAETPISVAILIISTLCIELEADSVLRQCLVISDKRSDAVLLESLEQAGGPLSDLEHRSLASVVRLHSCEVPSAKFIEVDGSIVVQIKINKSIIELLMIELEAELKGKSSKLILIDMAVAVKVESSEALLHLTILLLVVVVVHGTYATEKLLGVLVLV